VDYQKKATVNIVAKCVQVVLLLAAFAGMAVVWIGKAAIPVSPWILLALSALIWLGRALAGVATNNNATLYAVLIALSGAMGLSAPSIPGIPANSTEVNHAATTDVLGLIEAVVGVDAGVVTSDATDGPESPQQSLDAIVPLSASARPSPRRRNGRLRRSFLSGLVGFGILLSGCGTVGSQYVLRDNVVNAVCPEIDYLNTHHRTLDGRALNDEQLRLKLAYLDSLLDGRPCPANP